MWELQPRRGEVSTTEQAIRDFIVNEIGWDQANGDLGFDDPLIEGGVIDSMGVFHLISFLEDEFGVEVDDTDLVVDNFRSINTIARMVDRLST